MSKKATANLICPTPEEIPALVDRAAVLEAEIKLRQQELDVINARLKLASLASKATEPLKDEHREGRRLTLPGRAFRADVVISSDALIGSFRDGSEKHRQLLNILGGELGAPGEEQASERLTKFFDKPSKWESLFTDGLKFRARAAELLPPRMAAEFVAACRQTDRNGIVKNTVAISFTKPVPEEVASLS